jgi:hypothetical protein
LGRETIERRLAKGSGGFEKYPVRTISVVVLTTCSSSRQTLRRPAVAFWFEHLHDLKEFGIVDWATLGHTWDADDAVERQTSRPPKARPGVYVACSNKPFGRFAGDDCDVVGVFATKNLRDAVKDQVQRVGRDSTYSSDSSRDRLADRMLDSLRLEVAWTYTLNDVGARHLAGAILCALRDAHGELPPFNDRVPGLASSASNLKLVATAYGVAWVAETRRRDGGGERHLLVFASASEGEEVFQEFVETTADGVVGFEASPNSRLWFLDPTATFETDEQAVARTLAAVGA